MPQCLVSFGSNLGTRDAAIVSAARKLASLPGVENFRASRLFETPAIGGPSGQDSFLNGVAVFDTLFRARDVLQWLQSIEQNLGRQRQQRWAARSIDLDVVLHGALIGAASDLTVPHPRYTARRFVLRPACDVAPDYRDPRFGWTIQRLADHLDQGNASLALAGGDEATRQEICRRLQDDYQIRTFLALPLVQPVAVIGTAPTANRDQRSFPRQPQIVVNDDQPWVSGFVPSLTTLSQSETNAASLPRLVARIQWTRPEERWPVPHRIWPSTLDWPEYRLEVDDLSWATSEIVSALASMRCPLSPVSDDTHWWK